MKGLERDGMGLPLGGLKTGAAAKAVRSANVYRHTETDGDDIASITASRLVNGLLDTFNAGAGFDRFIADFSGLAFPATTGPTGIVFGDDEAFRFDGADRVHTSGYEEFSITGTPYDDVVRASDRVVFFDGGEGKDRLDLFLGDVVSPVVFDTSSSHQHLTFGGSSITNVEIFGDIITGSGDDVFVLHGDVLEHGVRIDLNGNDGFDRVEADFGDFDNTDPADARGITFANMTVTVLASQTQARFLNMEDVSIAGTRFGDAVLVNTRYGAFAFDAGDGDDLLNIDLSGSDNAIIDLTTAEEQIDFGGFDLSNFERTERITTGGGDDEVRLTSDSLVGNGTGTGGSIISAGLGIDALVMTLAPAHRSASDATTGARYDGFELFYGDSRVGIFAGFETLDITGSNADDFIGGGHDTKDILRGAGGADTLCGYSGNDTIHGGSNVDVARFGGNRDEYLITQVETGVFQVAGIDGIDHLTAIEFARFDDVTVRLRPGSGVKVNFESTDPGSYQSAMDAILDFDGNSLGGDGSWLRIGSADVNGDGDIDQILVNDVIARFATVGTAPDGLVYFNDNGWAGETRVAGIYIDPLVEAGLVERFSDTDSQQRFQNDLQIGNINRLLGADDYDEDGLQDVYLALTDGTAYLRAVMEADGNIRYANYQSEQQVIGFLEANGFGEETFGDWFGAGSAGAQALVTDRVSTAADIAAASGAVTAGLAPGTAFAPGGDAQFQPEFFG